MTAVFQTVLSMSLTGSVVIAAVLLARLLLKGAPKKFSYALWTAAGFRLCCPVSFASVFSLFRVPYVQTGNALMERLPIPASTQTVSSAATIPAAGTPPTIHFTPTVNWIQLLAIAWAAGVAVMVLFGMYNWLRLRISLRNSIKLEGNVRLSDAIDSPFILGIIRPNIYLPFGLPEQDQAHVLAHERCHLRRGDHIVKLLSYGILTLHWFNPLCWLAFTLMSRDMEMSCDEQVLKSSGLDNHAYSKTLVSIASTVRFPTPNPLAFGETAVKSRVKNALSWKRPKLWATVLAAALCLCVVAACATDPVTPGKELADGLYYGYRSAPRLGSNMGQCYFTVSGGKLTATYISSGAYVTGGTIDPNGWTKPPYTQEKWEEVMGHLDNNDLQDIETFEYQQLSPTSFLLRRDGEYYIYSTDGLSEQVIPWESEENPITASFARIEAHMQTILHSGGTETSDLSLEKVKNKIAQHLDSYNAIFRNELPEVYIAHALKDGVPSGEEGFLLAIIFEDALARYDEEPIVAANSTAGCQWVMDNLQAGLALRNQTNHNAYGAEHRATVMMLAYWDVMK